MSEAGLLSAKEGFTSSPTLLGIRAVPSVMAEKFMPINRSIISWVACNWSYPAMCDALKICGESGSELRLRRPWWIVPSRMSNFAKKPTFPQARRQQSRFEFLLPVKDNQGSSS